MITYDNMLDAVAAHCLDYPGTRLHLTNAQLNTGKIDGLKFTQWAAANGLTIEMGESRGFAGWFVVKNTQDSGSDNRLACLCAAASEGLLLMSRDNCHALKVSSIVVGRAESGGLLRMFLAWPGHRLAENHLYGNLPVGIHDHRYSLRLQLLTGKVRNTIYRRGSGRSLHEFEFRSGQMQGPPKTRRVGFAVVQVASQEWLSPDTWLTLDAAAMHNIDCEGPAAWLVEEGSVTQEVTRLFTPQAQIETGDLYQPFESAAAVRDHVARFISMTSPLAPYHQP